MLLLAAGFVLLVLVGVNTLRTEGSSSQGPAVGEPMPPFAAPLVLSDVEGDVNVAREDDQGPAGARAACAVRGPGIYTSCDAVRDRALALAFLTAGQERCVEAVGRLERAARRHPGVSVAAVALRGGRADLRELVGERGWRLPLAHDRDAVLANLYGVAVCPQVTYVLPGGKVFATTIGDVGEERLDADLARLERAAAQGRR